MSGNPYGLPLFLLPVVLNVGVCQNDNQHVSPQYTLGRTAVHLKEDRSIPTGGPQYTYGRTAVLLREDWL